MWFPADLKFVPHHDVTGLWPDSGEFDTMGDMIPFYEQLTELSEGTTLFEVWARREPEILCGGDPVASGTHDPIQEFQQRGDGGRGLQK